MREGMTMMSALVFSAALLCGCGGGGGNSGSGMTTSPAAATPTIASAANNGAQNGAVIVTLAAATSGSTIYYTVDGSTPTSSSQQYQAPFLVASNITVKAIATAAGYTASSVANQSFTPNIVSGTLVWADEFANTTGSNAVPNPAIWTYDTGNSGFGNHELENYCAATSNTAPCSTASPNAYVGTDGYLHIVAQQPSAGVYTSARMKTQGLFSFQYGRLEFRAQVPEANGFWPAAWLLGNNISTVNWPACREQDVLAALRVGPVLAQRPAWALDPVDGGCGETSPFDLGHQAVWGVEVGGSEELRPADRIGVAVLPVYQVLVHDRPELRIVEPALI